MRTALMFRALFLSLVCIGSAVAQTYTTSVLAGAIGQSGSADGTGGAARFASPSSMGADAAGNLYLVDGAGAAVRKITPAGVVTTLVSSLGGNHAIAVTAAGTVYLADRSNHAIYRLSSEGTLVLIAGQTGTSGNANGTGAAARFASPAGLTVDAAGSLYVSDTGNYTVRKITSGGVVTTLAGLAGVSGAVDGPGPLARFYSPGALATDASGNLYLLDGSNYSSYPALRRIAPSGEVSTLAGGSYQYSNSYDGAGSSVSFYNPFGLAWDASSGALFVTDTGRHTVRRVTTTGVVTTVLGLAGTSGSADGLGTQARFSSPAGLAVNAAGDLLIADVGNLTVRRAVYVPLPAITTQPPAVATNVGQTATFAVVATGGAAVTFQWQRQPVSGGPFLNLTDGGIYSGATTPTLVLTGATALMHGDQFRCVISNLAGTIFSAPAGLTVNAAPVFTNAASATFGIGAAGVFAFTTAGAPASTFAVTAGNFPPWAGLSAAAGLLSGTPTNGNGSPFVFTITATNTLGTASQTFTLTVPAPAIPVTAAVASGRRQVLPKGQSLTISATASGTGPLTYQWRRNGLPLTGATSLSYTILNAAATDAGYYQLAVNGPSSSAVSPAIFVTVTHPVVEVVGWGSPLTLPSNLGTATAIATGYYHALALKSDGTVTAWGSETANTTVPAGLNDVVAIAAGAYSSYALRSDGTVVAWGSNSYGQITLPAALGGVVALAASERHVVALKNDGTVVEWGTSYYYDVTGYPPPAGLSGVIGIAAGDGISLAIKSDGTVTIWGYAAGSYGTAPASIIPARSTVISGGAFFAIRADGVVVPWGSTSYSAYARFPAAGLSGVVQLAVSGHQGYALKVDGTVFAWGDLSSSNASPPAGLRSVFALSVGSSYRFALRDASNDTAPTIVAAPAPAVANLGQSVTFAVSASAGTAALTYQWFKDNVALSGATASTLTIGGVVLASAGSYHVVVSNSRGSATSDAALLQISASPVASLSSGGRYPLSPGQSLVLALAADVPSTATVSWRRNGLPIAGASARSYAIVNATPAHAGYYQAVYTTEAGTFVTAAIFVPFLPTATQMLTANNAGAFTGTPGGFDNSIALAARGNTLATITAAGRVMVAAVTSGYYGYDSPGSPPASLENVVAVSVATGFAAALRADGTVAVWGSNTSDTRMNVPAGLAGVVAISAGTSHVLALKGDGTVVAWGLASAGATSVPAGLSQIIAVSAGDNFSLALRADGTVVGWGRNASGESSPPTGLSGVTAIAVGSSHALALRFDGTVVAWGSTSYGATAVPAGLSGVVRIAAGDQHSLALRTDGIVVGWGSGGAYSSPVPKLVPAGLRDVIELGAFASGYSAFLRDASADTVPVITAQPADAVAALGQTAILRVSATAGTAPLTYRWRKAGVAIVGATDATFTLPGVTAATAGTYDVSVSNYLGSVTSRTLTLGVSTSPGVALAAPARRLVSPGTAVTLAGTVSLSGAVTYQWRFNGRAIPGATLATYALPAARFADNGSYQLVASNAVGPAASSPVYVAVTGPRQIRVWGPNTSGVGSPPAGLTDVVALAAGSSHALALRTDGTVVTWGGGGAYGLANVPADLTDVIAIAAGYNTSLALRADGTVAAWGQLNYVPSTVTNVVALSASPSTPEAIALRADGTVVVWTTEGVRSDTPVALGDLVEVAASAGVRYALRSDGTLLYWRSADSYSSITIASLGVIPGDIVSIAQGAYDYVLYTLRRDGTVGVFNASTGEYSPNSSVTHTGVAALAIGAGGYSYFLKSDGRVVSLSSESGHPTSAASVSPALQIAAGNQFGLALRDPSGDVAPVITVQPTPVQVASGQPFSLSVTATGSPQPIYQWYRNAQVISGATSATYAVTGSNSYSSVAGSYSVAVINALGTVTSADVVVTIVSNDLSSRGFIRGAIRANAALAPLSATFTLEGAYSKSLLLRGAGPALVPFGTTDALADPMLTLHAASGALLLTNDNWGPVYNVNYTASQLGGFVFAEGSRDAGFLRTFTPGTAHVTLAGTPGSGGGVALLELFDTDSSYGSRVTYLSTLAHAGMGNDVFVLGFTLAAAPAGRTYLLRALGPALGGTGFLADPRLAVFDSANTQVAANDDWAGDSTMAAAVGTAGLMPLAPNAKDAALVFTPVAGGGSYTVRLNGAPGTTGRVLVELAEIDTQRGATIPVALVAPPRSVTVLPGQSVAFGGVAVGKPTPAYQWRKDGVDLPGATSALLTLAAAQAADAGDYTLVVSNAHGSVTSSPATLALAAQLATHRLVGPGYVAGSTLTVTNTLTFTGTAAGLGWEVVLPTGWSYAGGSGEGDLKPAVGATGTLGWSWTTPPASPLTFTYVLNVPADEASSRTLAATGLVRTGESPQPAALPALVVTAAAPVHSADTNHDNRLNLTELTRAIELYNTRHGTARTGAYAVAATATEDGFEADATRAPGATAALSLFHSADTNRDGAIGLFELTRVIELYNARRGNTRTGAYRSQGSTEDGFAPGP